MWTEITILVLSALITAYLISKRTNKAGVSIYEFHSGTHDYPFANEKLKIEFIAGQNPILFKEYSATVKSLKVVSTKPLRVRDLVSGIVIDVVMLNIASVETGCLYGLLTNEYANSALVLPNYLAIIQKRSESHWLFWHFMGVGGGNIYTLNATAYVRNLFRKSIKEEMEGVELEQHVTLLIEYAFFYIKMIPMITNTIKIWKRNDKDADFSSVDYWQLKFSELGIKCPKNAQNCAFMAEVAALACTWYI